MTPALRERFDELLDDAVEALPANYRRLLDEVSVVVLDLPTKKMLLELERDGVVEPGMDPTELCGLHTGAGITDRGVDDTGVLRCDHSVRFLGMPVLKLHYKIFKRADASTAAAA